MIDVLQDECHQAVYEGVPKQSMIKGWRKKFLEKSKNIKKFIELQSCAIYELDSLNPKLTEDPSDDALIQVRLLRNLHHPNDQDLIHHSRCMMILKPNPLPPLEVFSILSWIIFLDSPTRGSSPAHPTIRLMLLKKLIVSKKWPVLNNKCKHVICSFAKLLLPVSDSGLMSRKIWTNES